MTLEKSLKLKTPKEKSRLKSQEISKLKYAGVFDSPKESLRVEIVGDVTLIDINGQTGVQVFARAWKNGQQLGFGDDGSVDIERFAIFNPPVLVDDPVGEIVREIIDPVDGKIIERHLREDPLSAIIQTVFDAANFAGKKGTSIVPDKTGRTTTTFFPDASTGGTTVDGNVWRDGGASTWASFQGGAGTNVDDTTTDSLRNIRLYGKSSAWEQIRRCIFTFDTSAVGSSSTISAAVLSLYGTTKGDQAVSLTPDIDIYTSTPAANNDLVAADYTQLGTVSQTGAPISYASFSTAGYNDFTFNATGIGNISKTSISKFGARNANYDAANVEPTSASADDHWLSFWFADETGTASDPKLVVTYSAAASGPANLKSLNTNLKANVKTYNTNPIANIKSINTNV